MKMITLNIAHHDNLGQDYYARMQRIAEFLDGEQADIVCMQALSFFETESQADEISHLMKKPYKYIVSELSRKLKITDVPLEKRSDGMRELFAKDAQAFFTDGQAVLSNLPIAKTKTFFLTEVPPDANGRVDRHPHIAQNVDFENGVKISNTHLASNQNAYMQLDEIIRENNDSERLIIGDINLTHEHMQEHKKGWGDRFIDSTEFLNYISFPDDNVAYDHLLLPKGSRFISVRTVDGLSDHSAVVFEIKEKN